MQLGLKLLKSIIHQTSSKVAIAVCAFLARKVQALNRENGDALKKLPVGQENRQKASELRKVVTMLTDERGKIEEKLMPFEAELEQAKEPLDILFLKFAEEEGLTQEK